MKMGKVLWFFVLVFLAAILFGGCTKNEKETTADKIQLLRAQAELEVMRGQAAKNRAALVKAQTESLQVVGNILEIKSRAELLKAQADSHKYTEERSTYIIGTCMLVLIIVAAGAFISLNKSSKRNQKLQSEVNMLVSLAAPKYSQIPEAALALLIGAGQSDEVPKIKKQNLLSSSRSQPAPQEKDGGSSTNKKGGLAFDFVDEEI